MLTQKEVENRISKFGLTLLSTYKGFQDKTKLSIKCKCGNIFEVSSKHILQGHTKSCGCLRTNNLIGKRFGKLLVVKQIPKKERSYGGKWYLCKCDCGGIKETVSQSLVNGATTTCGCAHYGENSNQWKGYKNISGKFWCLLKNQAKRRNLEVTISKEYIQNLLEKQEFKCSLSGIPIQIHVQSKENTASLDRIDSTKGYVMNNVQWVHKTVNTMKWDISTKEFLDWCKRICNNHKT